MQEGLTPEFSCDTHVPLFEYIMASGLRFDYRLTPDAVTQHVLVQCQSSREIIRDFVPLAVSLEWDLGQEYLRATG